ncbi:MAG: hypothetical protein M3005_03420 [Apilactobacillus sp.]|uniref:hypothetical protein n=1 Tax=Apilactobacillus sp. TaxID=2767901 RepID=UPI0025FFAB06|nr:hypothetical protein [Apilactobacillus sp.]MCT6822905.1 hypothetical protein [Apilactobacillus sp.]MCT6858339.1 hypothetical protein [Apilactobacillus sp.]
MNSETKNEKFHRLAEKRTNDIIDKLRLISNLSNSQQYEYTKKEVNDMFKAIREALDRSESSFDNEVIKSNNKFKFKK